MSKSLVTPKQAAQLRSIDEEIARLNVEPTILKDKKGKEYISIRQVEANLDVDFGPDGWSWEVKQFIPMGSVGLDNSQNPMIGVFLQGDLTVCFENGNCKIISGVVSDFVSRGTIRNPKGNKGSILSSMALKNAAAKLGKKYGRGYFDEYVADEIQQAIETVTAEQWRDQILAAKTREELSEIWGQIPASTRQQGSKLYEIFTAKGQQLAEVKPKAKANA